MVILAVEIVIIQSENVIFIKKALVEKHESSNVCLSIKFWGILTTHEFDMRNI